MGMLKSCHLFTFAVIMEILIKGCSSVFPYTLIKLSKSSSEHNKPGLTYKQHRGFELAWLTLL